MDRILIVFFVTVVHVIIFLPCTKAQTAVVECPGTPRGVTELKNDVYFNGPSKGSKNFFPQVCNVYKEFGSALSLSFKVGAYIGYNLKHEFVCFFFDNENCTEQYQYACASHMLSDFKRFVCCHLNEEKDLNICLTDQNVDLDKFRNCYERKTTGEFDPQAQLIQNSKALFNKAPENYSAPYEFFNDQHSVCMSDQGFSHWKSFICKMFKDPNIGPCRHQ